MASSSSAVNSAIEKLANIQLNELSTSSSPNLQKNLSILSPDQIELGKMLLELGQGHLFEHWPDPGVDDDDKRALLTQVSVLNSSYPGGLSSYIKTAKELLADSKAGKNPFDGFTPSVPSGETLNFGDDNFIQYEEVGVQQVQNAAFVLVAGGLGERLGYNGIKLALPMETTTGTCFLQHYIESILSLSEASFKQAQGESRRDVPLVIMTSDDTHERTLQLLESNDYFGMKPTQVKLLKQEKVACLADNDARLALDPNNKYRIQCTNPRNFCRKDTGLRWVLFFQDTNGLLFKAIPAALGVSATKEYHVNSLAVPRKAKEAIGGITKLTHTDGREMVINVEYNQLDPLLRATGHPDGDVNCETGYSPYPGNINQLILELGPYIDELSKTGGAIKEFVNPKYKDSTKTEFKSSTRLECMMQDYPKTLSPSARVGFTAGVKVDDPVTQVFNGQEVEVWSRVVWKPKWAVTFADVKSKVSGNNSVSQKSTLVIKGRDIFIEDLSLDGALIVDAVDDAEVKVGGSVCNGGWTIESIDKDSSELPEEVRIRGFKINKSEQVQQFYGEPGKFSSKP
ncbi:hypothetical protein M8C21_003375 [Ambrosia artemisiifolia]|uniref:UTP-monosaccharide-1-phosphate uridylyltransferase n=1 Tax=Ambrosia artemisiifolia TaxID=4212 RepID=A0AAD5G6M1_AMBAR|nr:hypothetical protein M8C21_003375 [Ambrosia artemisiifolia]